MYAFMRIFAAAALAALIVVAPAALANWPLPPHGTFPCTPPGDPCYQCDDWPKVNAFQVRLAARSARNTASGPDGSGSATDSCSGALPRRR